MYAAKYESKTQPKHVPTNHIPLQSSIRIMTNYANLSVLRLFGTLLGLPVLLLSRTIALLVK